MFYIFFVGTLIVVAIIVANNQNQKLNNMFDSGDVDILITQYFDLGKTVPTRFKATSQKIYIGDESINFKDITKAYSYDVKNRYRFTRNPYVSNPYKEAITYYLSITYMSGIERVIKCYSFKINDYCMYDRIAKFINKKVRELKRDKINTCKNLA